MPHNCVCGALRKFYTRMQNILANRFCQMMRYCPEKSPVCLQMICNGSGDFCLL